MPTSANTFQTNVHRQKTRKWVEAKAANYDGDDWGDDDDDDGTDDYRPPSMSVPRQATMPPLPRLQQHQQLYQQQQQQKQDTAAAAAAVAVSSTLHSASATSSKRPELPPASNMLLSAKTYTTSLGSSRMPVVPAVTPGSWQGQAQEQSQMPQPQTHMQAQTNTQALAQSQPQTYSQAHNPASESQSSVSSATPSSALPPNNHFGALPSQQHFHRSSTSHIPTSTSVPTGETRQSSWRPSVAGSRSTSPYKNAAINSNAAVHNPVRPSNDRRSTSPYNKTTSSAPAVLKTSKSGPLGTSTLSAMALPPRSVSIGSPLKAQTSSTLPHNSSKETSASQEKQKPEPLPLHLAAPIPSKPLSSVTLRGDNVSPLVKMEAHTKEGQSQQRGSSTSPRLPDVARMSLFTVNFGDTYGKDLESAPPIPALPPLTLYKNEKQHEKPPPSIDQTRVGNNSDVYAISSRSLGNCQPGDTSSSLSESPAPTSAALAPPQSQLATNSSPATSSIHTSSSTKESDRLREEILQSLGPSNEITSTPPINDQVPTRRSTHDSKYLSNIYGDYWPTGDGDETATVAATSSVIVPIGLGINNNGASESVAIAPLSGRKSQHLDMALGMDEKISVAHEMGHAQNEEKRRDFDSSKEVVVDGQSLGTPQRFSWEALSIATDGPSDSHHQTSQTEGSSLPARDLLTQSSTAPAPAPSEHFHIEPDTHSATTDLLVPPPVVSRPSFDSLPEAVAAHDQVSSVGEGVSANLHQANSAGTKVEISVVADTFQDTMFQSEPETRLSPVLESSPPIFAPATETVTTPPSQTNSTTFDSLPTTAAAALDSPPPRVIEPMALRDMLRMSAVSDRMESMNNARKYYLESKTGLSTWVSTMQTDYPEYKLETSIFSKSILPYIPASRSPGSQANLLATSPPRTSSGAATGFSCSHTDFTIPLSQTASASYTATATGGVSNVPAQPNRPTLGGGGLASTFHLPTTTSDLKHSGAKGKEFLLAAGKAGKGLLSKGKSKFRGTGEKVFPY
ncbi:hypothetical protein Cpir12675_002844 [Ceratocystis pirilliformis]|uniref:Uncharacterized protein n=1 Tax=Ceratocystis pirilliformis TaxID=259994 RepID=A0ABR3Z6J4_9PEZI